MAKRVVKFQKKRKYWYINYVACCSRHVPETSPLGLTNYYLWNFTPESGLEQAIKTLREDYSLDVEKVKSPESTVSYATCYNIRFKFKDESDEVLFVMMASNNLITLDDKGNRRLFG